MSSLNDPQADRATAAPIPITPELLRGWPLPTNTESKHTRGRVVVVGGASATPGAVMLAGIAALRVGAGHLTLAVAESVAAGVAVAVPECGVIALPETAHGSVSRDALGVAATALQNADAVLVGPGLDNPDETAALLRVLPDVVGPRPQLVLDAYALGVLREVPECAHAFAGRLTLTPNEEEAKRLLARDEPTEQATVDIAREQNAVVTCFGHVANPAGVRWHVFAGHGGLATSGSGDVLAGAVVGLLARGADPDQATCWGVYAHATAGDRLAAQIGQVGFLARELLDHLPRILTELSV
jgi:ADP-dependent NAD(P)H-hydrate dehydratase